MQLPNPSLQNGYIDTFQKQIKMSIDNQQININDQILIKLYFKQQSQTYKIQLTSQTNVSFFYKCFISKNNFEQYIKKQSKHSKAKNFTQWFKGFFENTDFIYKFQLQNQNQAQLIILEEQKYKNYEIIRFSFTIVDYKELKLNIMYRYQRMKLRKQYLDWYWKQMTNIVKTKNPSLLVQLQAKNKKQVFK